MNFTRSILCPIHGQIQISEYEKNIINSKLFQRLRYLHQLTLCDMVFQGATHTRFSHSIGVMHLTGKYAQQLFPISLENTSKNKENQHLQQLARLAGLLHDIAHGPYSHAWDWAVYSKSELANSEGTFTHDEYRHIVIEYPILKELIEASGVKTEEIKRVWNNEKGVYQIIAAIIEGPVGSDRLDYLSRDAHFTGVQYFNQSAIERIILNCKVIDDFEAGTSDVKYIKEGCKIVNEWQTSQILVYNLKTQDDIHHCLKARYYMYKNVYFHKTVRYFDLILRNMIERYVQLKPNDMKWPMSEEGFQTLTEFEILNRIQALNDPQCNHYLDIIRYRLFDEELRYIGVDEKRKVQHLSIDDFEKYHIGFYDKYHADQIISVRHLWKDSKVVELPFTKGLPNPNYYA